MWTSIIMQQNHFAFSFKLVIIFFVWFFLGLFIFLGHFWFKAWFKSINCCS